MSNIWIVFRKETLDNFRDRRAVFNALFTVLFNPLLYIFLFGFLNRSFTEQIERPLELPLAGGEHAPSLVQFLEQHNVVILPAPDDPETAVRGGDVDLVLIIDEEYAERFQDGLPAPVELVIDDSNQGADIAVNRTRNLLNQYSGQIGSLRLLARGVSPAVVQAVTIETRDVAPQEQAEAGIVLNLLPIIMITAAFFGGFYLAVDMTAGERERDSLEPLLINPVPRGQLVLGKYLTALAFTTLATFLATALFLVLLGLPFVQDFVGIRVNLGWDVIGTAVALMIPVVIMAVALEMLVASFAQTVKEAQTYTQLVALVGFLPSIFLAVLPVKSQPWMTYIPTISQLFLINKVARGEPLAPGEVLVASVITVAIGILAVRYTMRLYNSERIILGKPAK